MSTSLLNTNGMEHVYDRSIKILTFKTSVYLEIFIYDETCERIRILFGIERENDESA